MNFILRTDSYKITHWKQYPPHTDGIYSYLESRGGLSAETIFFGLQYYLKAYFEGPRFTLSDISDAAAFCKVHFGQPLFNEAGWTRLYQKFGGPFSGPHQSCSGGHGSADPECPVNH
jgi:nicotinamide phosphoribosyltransferase